MINWIVDNYQWFFSGLGVFLLTIIGLFVKRGRKRTSVIKDIIKMGSKTQVNIIQSESDVQILYQNLPNINTNQVFANILKEREIRTSKLKAELEEEVIDNPKKTKAREHNKRAVQLGRENKYKEALINIRNAINLDPEEDIYRNNLIVLTQNYAGSLIFNSGLFDEAITLINKLEQEGLLNDGYSYWLLGQAYFKKRLFDQAIDAYKQAIICEPKDYLKYLYLAEAYCEKGVEEKDLNYQKKALEEVERSLRLNPQAIKDRSEDIYPSFVETVLLNILLIISQDNFEQLKQDYKDFLIRLRYSSEEINELTKEGRFSFILASIAFGRYKSRIEREVGIVDLDTLLHRVKTVEEIQAMVKEIINEEVPVPAILSLLKALQIFEVDQKEAIKLLKQVVHNFGEEKLMVFAKGLDEAVIKKGRRWIIYMPEAEKRLWERSTSHLTGKPRNPCKPKDTSHIS